MRTFVFSLCCAAALFAQDYKIVGPVEPKPYEATAIKDLTEYLGRRVKGILTIGGKSGVTFHVGDTELAKSKGLMSSELPDEKWIVKSFGDQILINGGGRHGALYATYHFLEDCCDVHWWSDFEDYVPPASPLALPTLDMSGRPYFRYRNIYRGSATANELTAFRNRLNANGAHVKSTAAVGGSVDYGSPAWTHTHAKYISEEEFFKDHPEYFALRDGKRMAGWPNGQLCLSHPDLPEIFARKMCEYIEKDRAQAAKDGVPYPIFYDVSENDNLNACRCPKCLEYVEKYSYSTQLIEFLNEIAKRVAPKYPDIFISSLAYNYTDTPPKKDIRTEKNVVIRLCDTTTNQAFSILHPENARFKAYVEQWKKHTDYLSIWDYAVAYHEISSTYPFAGEFYYGDLYKFYRDNNVQGIFWEHEYENRTDMFEYKFFLECKLMEDPDADIAKLQNIFMTRYYGAAAPFVLEHRRLIDRACHENKGKIACATEVPFTSFAFLTDSVMREIDAVMDKAEAAVTDDATLRLRVNRARLGVDLLAFRRHKRLNLYGFDAATENTAGVNLQKAAVRLDRDWRKWTERYPAAKSHLAKIDRELKDLDVKSDAPTLKVPAQFKDSRFVYFRPEECTFFGNTISLVDDAESSSGRGARFNGKSLHYYRLPFGMGCYDAKNRKAVVEFSMGTVGDSSGYNWYKMGRVTVTEECILYFNRSWTIQVPISYPETMGRTFDVWAELKFTGPMYHPEIKDGESFINLGLVVLEEVPKE